MGNLRRIGICFPGMSEATLFDSHARDNCHEPFIALRDRLRKLGHVLTVTDGGDLADLRELWFWDVAHAVEIRSGVSRRMAGLLGASPYTASPLVRRALRSHLRDRLVLFLGEPPVVSPANWDARLHKPYRTVFTWHDPLVDGRRYLKYSYPLPTRYPSVSDRPFRHRKLLVTISGNKSSAEPGELYSARRRSIRFFERHAAAEFDLYGTDWERGDDAGAPYPSFRGSVAHKWQALPRYRFSLCYENQQLTGYVTEKLFDSLRCGVVPVYLGAPEIAETIDPRCFVDRRDFRDEAQLLAYLRAMTEAEFEERREAAQAVLAGDVFARHLSTAFADTVCTGLRLADG